MRKKCKGKEEREKKAMEPRQQESRGRGTPREERGREGGGAEGQM